MESENEKKLVILWNCPNCGFGFDAIHTDWTGEEGEEETYSCPLCAELRLEKELSNLCARITHLANKPIGVFGEGFSWEFHYKSLKDDLKRLVKSWDQYPREE